MNKKLIGSAVVLILAAGAVFLAMGRQEAPAGPVVQVTKNPACACCAEWVEHLKDEGFQVEVENTGDMAAAKRRWRVPGDLSSCHTARVGEYVIEGHVPGEDIRRLLAEKPDIVGLAVPGMPVGSPGMEGPRPVRYEVVAFDGSGGREVYATH